MAIGRPIELTPNVATKNISSIATADQTEFTVTGGYRINEIAVYRNGVRLADGRDFTASDGLTVNLVTGCVVDDIVEFAVFDSFNIAGTIVSAASSQNLSGDLNVTGNLYSGTFNPTELIAGIATVNTALHVGSALTANAAGDVETIGIITAATFKGDGSGLTGIGETVNVRTNTITVSGVSTFTGAVNVDATTDSTSVTTGALIVDGGVGIAKNVYIGAGLSVAGTLTYEDVTNVDSVGLITAKSGVNVSGGQLQVGVAYSVGAAGVATAAGFVGGTIAGSTGTFTGDVDIADKIVHTGDTNTAIRFPAADTFTVETGGSERVRVDSNGKVGIGTDNPDEVLSLFGSANNVRLRIDSQNLKRNNYIGVSGSDNVEIAADEDNAGSASGIRFRVDAVERARLNASGNLGIGTVTPARRLHLHDQSSDTVQLHITNSTTGVSGSDGVSFALGSDESLIINQRESNKILFKTADTDRVSITSGGDVELSGTAAGVSSVTWDASANSLIFNDDSKAVFGTGSDLQIYHSANNWNYITSPTSRNLSINPVTGEAGIQVLANQGTHLFYDGSERLKTTYDGIEMTGFTSTTAGMGVTGGLFEGSFIKAGKLSDNTTLGISTANFFYFTTQETTTATPNIVWNDSYSLSSKMAVGDVASVTVVTTAAAGGYSANWTIDGNAVTEEWVGGSAPSAGGADGLDIYSLTIIKTGTGTGDSGFKVIANVSNAT